VFLNIIGENKIAGAQLLPVDVYGFVSLFSNKLDLQNIHLNRYNVVCGVLYVAFSFGHCVICSSSIYGF
jgi:hypothetical protein